MNSVDTKYLRSEISRYAKPNNKKALSIFVLDLLIYMAGISGIIFIENLFLRVLCSVIIGLKMSTLFVIAHDAAHESYVSTKFLNRLIARISFLVSYHNFSLWLIVHNKNHHQSTNVKGFNSWSPYSKEDYDQFSNSKKITERFYRTVPGIGFYYLVERWFKEKFYPFQKKLNKKNLHYWLDFLFVSSYMVCLIVFLYKVGGNLIYSSPIEMVFLGFIIPCYVSCFMIGITVYQQHTHETIPWFNNISDRKEYGVEEVTMYVKYPWWYNILSHNAMEHTAHHVHARVPMYNLPAAQKVLCNILKDRMHIVDMSIFKFMKTIATCKLYDYDNHCWLDFNGEVIYEIGREVEEYNQYLFKLAA